MGRFSCFMAGIAALAVIGTSCSNPDGVTVRVTAVSPEKSVLYLSRVDFKRTVTLDSAKIPQGESTKRFRVKQGAEPEFYTVSIRGGGAVTVLAQQGEVVDVRFDAGAMPDYTVAGSAGSELVRLLAVEFAKSKAKHDELAARYAKAGNEAERAKIAEALERVRAAQKEFSLGFIKENPMSKASVMAIYQKYSDSLFVFDSADDLLTLKTVASAWRALYPESAYTKGMVEEVRSIEKAIRNSQLQQLISQAGVAIPELELPNRRGEPVKLSSLKGKVVLLDFWHTASTASLLDNRELLGIYRQYRARGFEVYQVALDTSRSRWMSAVEQANLPWISVCEGNPNGSRAAVTYNVQQIPANFLIGKDQSIIGKNLYGENLRKAIAEALR